MEIIHSPRQSGKTTKMIDWVAKRRDRILIVMNEHRAEQLEKEFEILKGRNQVMTLRDYMQRAPAMPRTTTVGIDDVEEVVGGIVKHNIKMISLSEV